MANPMTHRLSRGTERGRKNNDRRIRRALAQGTSFLITWKKGEANRTESPHAPIHRGSCSFTAARLRPKVFTRVIDKPQEKWLANCKFGGKDLDTLYATCGDKLFKRKTKTKGVLSSEAPVLPPPPRL